MEELPGGPDRVDPDDGLGPVSVAVRIARQAHQVGMPARCDPAKYGIVFVDRERIRRRVEAEEAVLEGFALGEDEARDPVGQCRLADSGRAGDQPGMGQSF